MQPSGKFFIKRNSSLYSLLNSVVTSKLVKDTHTLLTLKRDGNGKNKWKHFSSSWAKLTKNDNSDEQEFLTSNHLRLLPLTTFSMCLPIWTHCFSLFFYVCLWFCAKYFTWVFFLIEIWWTQIGNCDEYVVCLCCGY